MTSNGPDRINRKAALQAISRAVSIYWEHQKALTVPDHLSELAAKVDEALAKRVSAPAIVPSAAPVGSGDASRQITQAKDTD